MSNILDGIPLHDLVEDHLNSLQLLRVSEGPRLEFKAELNMSTSAEKREVCKDISALANSQGGYVLYGVSEANGVISGIPGIDFDDPRQQQFFQIVTSGIAPRVQSLSHTIIRLRNGRSAFVVRVEPGAGRRKHYLLAIRKASIERSPALFRAHLRYIRWSFLDSMQSMKLLNCPRTPHRFRA